MKTVYLKIYLLILFKVICTTVYSQPYDSILNKLDRQYPQEKLYLQFDRSVYNPGEAIWFKAYLFSGNLPSLISKTLYTELTDATGRVLQRITAPFIMSGAAGSLEIPADISGTVIVRAYTKWMLNFDSSFLYTKAIQVITPQKPSGKIPPASQSKLTSLTSATSATSYVLQFFPEGGDLVQGVQSRVAFKATDRNGIPINIAGDILNSKQTKITTFTSIHDGMGTFILQPQIAETYKAFWKDNRGQNHETALPAAKQNGVVLEIENFLNQIAFKIKRAPNAQPYSFVYIVAQMNQQLLYRAKVNINKTSSASGVFPTQNLPSGIVQITVFTPDEQPVAERIVFANLSNYEFITDLNSTLKDVGKRKKNVIHIDVPDTLVCNLSVAVTDADINPTLSGDNIYSHLLLTSDIKGYVYNPAYYFSSDADSIIDHLDLVMMTNGWRRFKWQDVLAEHFPKLNYMPENYISIDGQVHGLNKKLLAGKEINGIIELKNMNKQFLSIPVEPDGKFKLTGIIFYDTAKIFYQFNNDKNMVLTSRASFDIKSDLLKDPINLPLDNSVLFSLKRPDTMLLIKNKEIYQQQITSLESQKIKTLKTVVVTTRKKSHQELMDEEYTSGLFSFGDSRIILPENDPAFLTSQNLLNYLQGRVAGLQVYFPPIPGGDASITWRGFTTALFVNEVQQQDATQIMSLQMSDIAMVKIFNPPFFGAVGGGGARSTAGGGSGSTGGGGTGGTHGPGGSGSTGGGGAGGPSESSGGATGGAAGAGGAIAVYLRKGGSLNQMTKGLDFTLIPGYSAVKEFYSPDYSKPDPSDALDYRSTLYWNPFIFIDKDHRSISLPFYNNDFTKKIKVIIEGINGDGKLTRVEKILQ